MSETSLLKKLKTVFIPDFLRMVEETRLKKRRGETAKLFTFDTYSNYTGRLIDEAIDYLREVLPPEDEETVKLIETYDYFNENRAEILDDHNMAPG
jgi:hypothetical protein